MIRIAKEWTCDVCGDTIRAAHERCMGDKKVKYDDRPATWATFMGQLICPKHDIMVVVDGTLFKRAGKIDPDHVADVYRDAGYVKV